MIESLYKPFQKWSEEGTIWIFSDPHFEDEDLVNAYDDRPSADELVRRINSKVGKCDTLICLGDVGALSYVPLLRGYKVLVMGNHDAGRTIYERQRYWKKFDKERYTKTEALDEMKRCYPNREYGITRGNEFNSLFDYWEVCADNGLFDEVYEGPVMISPKLMLSHEPINCGTWALNIHGHIHARSHKNGCYHYNVCADCHDYLPLNLNQFLKSGAFSYVVPIHRQTIDEATARCKKRGYRLTSPKNK
nr:MAG TPA: metallophosphatase domain protein [Caudoviricetes sp.]